MNAVSGVLKKLLTIGVFAILVLSPTQYSFQVGPKIHLSVVDPLIWVVFLLWAICCAMRIVRWRLPSLFAALLILAASLSGIKASNRMDTAKELFQLVEYFGAAYILFASLISDVTRRRLAVHVFTGVGTAIVVFSLIQYFSKSLTVLEVSGTFGNRNVLGGYLALLLPLMAGLMFYEKNYVRLIWYGLTVAAGLIVDLSGGSIIGVLVALAAVAVLRRNVVYVALVAVLLSGVFLVFPRLPRDNAGEVKASVNLYDEDGEVSRRYTEWQAAATMAERNPLVGVGAGNYQRNIGMYYGILPNPTGPAEPDTQNLYMVLVSSMGWLGLAAFLGLLCSAGVQAAKQYFAAGPGFDRGLAAGLVGAIAAFGIACIWSPLLVRGIGVPLAFLLSLTATSGTADKDDVTC